MKSRLLPLLLWVLCSQFVHADFRAGIAFRVVTPDPLLPVSGGVGPSNPVKAKHGEITVRALVFEQDGTRLALVSADFLGFPGVLGDRVRKLVKDIPAANILIGATHTHSAPDAYCFPDGKGGTSGDLKYLDSVVAQAAAAINEAVTRLAPATLKTASGEAHGQIAYNYYAPELYDPRVNVIQAIGSDGKPMATLVNYAVHPEVIGSGAGICSPDLIGPLYDRLAELGAGTGIFLNSAQGGMVTADNRRPGGGEARDWAECQRIGRLLAEESLRVLQDAPEQREPKMLVASRMVKFPVESALLLAIMRGSPLGYAADAEGKVTTRLNLVNLGTVQMLTIPGEALPNIGYYLKRKMRGKPNCLFGLTNDAFGYILTEVDWNSFKRYNYVSQTCLGEKTGEILIEEALKLIAENPVPTAN
jgi:hypothetical protein